MSDHTSNEQNTSTTIDCAESVDIRFVEEIKKTLINAIELGRPIKINAGKVERFDTAGLQLFSSFVNDAHKKGVQVDWVETTDALIKAAKLTGLTHSLNLD
jgi:anti-anti-sigma factor